MRIARVIQCVDVHAEGEPSRIVIGGVLDVPGETMLVARHARAGAMFAMQDRAFECVGDLPPQCHARHHVVARSVHAEPRSFPQTVIKASSPMR